MEYSAHSLRTRLIQLVNKPLNLVLNRNRCTYIKAVFQDPIFISVHEAFTQAPETIIQSLALYINGQLQEEEHLYNYMQSYYKDKTIPESHGPISPKGRTYDLNLLYQQINTTFFKNNLSLQTTWWKNSPIPGAHQCTLGVFLDTLQLIKIHSLLDSPLVPQYVVESILFHEMVHAIVPTEKDTRGRTLVHTKQFKECMKQFPHSERADEWLKNNRSHFFNKK